MTIQVTCCCGQMFAAEPFLAGKIVNCPTCGSPLSIPAAEATHNAIRVSCNCGQVLQAASALAGKKANCPNCGAPVLIPLPQAIKPTIPTATQLTATRAQRVVAPPAADSDADTVVDLRNLKELVAIPKVEPAKPHAITPLPQINVRPPQAAHPRNRNLIIGVIASTVAVGVVAIGSGLLLLFLPVLQDVRGARSGPWITYRSPEHGYSVSFPHPPQFATDSAVSMITCDLGPSGSYRVAANDIAVVGLNPEKFLDEAVHRGASAVNGQLIGEKDIELDGNLGREYSFAGTRNGASFKASGRIYVVGNKLYQLLFFDTSGADSNADTQKFFNSFKLPHG